MISSRLKNVALSTGLLILTLLVSQCSEDTEGPPQLGSVTKVTGDNQLSLRGTALPIPLKISVKTVTGEVVEGLTVSFRVIAGDGFVTPTSAVTSVEGTAETRLTLGNQLGTHRVRATVEGGEGGPQSVEFTATAANFFCPEQSDTLQVCGDCPIRYGAKGLLMLGTQHSSLFPGEGGVARVSYGTMPDVEKVAEIPSGNIFATVVWDIAFSARGDLYLSGRQTRPTIFKIDTQGNVTTFATFQATGQNDEIEIDFNPEGLLVGCDETGPFTIGCRDSVTRYQGAVFGAGSVNNDAVAVDPRQQLQDPLGGDIYFILLTDNTLMRVPLDGGQLETAGVGVHANLTLQEASNARGMVVRNGEVFILIDKNTSPVEKKILKIATDGTKTTFVDFVATRGAGAAAGRQTDIATFGALLFTLDALNNQIVVIEPGPIVTDNLFTDDAVKSRLSALGDEGADRVGLAAIP